MMNVLNTVFLTILLTILLAFDIYPSWFVVSGLILTILLLSVWITNRVVRAVEAPR